MPMQDGVKIARNVLLQITARHIPQTKKPFQTKRGVTTSLPIPIETGNREAQALVVRERKEYNRSRSRSFLEYRSSAPEAIGFEKE